MKKSLKTIHRESSGGFGGFGGSAGRATSIAIFKSGGLGRISSFCANGHRSFSRESNVWPEKLDRRRRDGEATLAAERGLLWDRRRRSIGGAPFLAMEDEKPRARCPKEKTRFNYLDKRLSIYLIF
ncbi:hypothetical protein AALP_AA4G120700 [Arabis alpina]|uniref:Uncharacterized protein n=1 Tax=Arabis alpina TaxID=50452 RepID=A0A087H2R1_ARAAL|nr:hypothetical protein AALP_AA4G120700 [Arabis alpina]